MVLILITFKIKIRLVEYFWYVQYLLVLFTMSLYMRVTLTVFDAYVELEWANNVKLHVLLLNTRYCKNLIYYD